jgi:diketogulonate reductase-like aldo/keto reductase
MQVGMVPLTGTKDEVHMREDLGVFKIQLTSDEVELIESVEG